MNIFNLIFPRRCIFCNAPSGADEICGYCKSRLPWWGKLENLGGDLPITAPFKYEGKARRALLDFKFHGRHSYARTFSALMETSVRDHYGADSFDTITFVPLHRLRRLRRGYNQAELLANALSRKIGVQVTKTLTKPRRTTANSKLNSAQRSENVISAFRLKQGARVSGKRILLVDDVCTTGATLQEAAKILMQAGAAQVMCAAVCRTI
ncbi:MAG: ComF family protein [Oscillospiraceae bacterium]|jgi:ComF family protein|nr:ComF family protein [Oscillospiraceae bacterium]